MKKLTVLFALLLAPALFACGPHVCPCPAAPKKVGCGSLTTGAEVSRMAVMIKTPTCLGSGTLIIHNDRLYVLSCHHVCGDVTPDEDGWPLVLRTRVGKVELKRTGRVVAACAKSDLALVEIRPHADSMHGLLGAADTRDDPEAEAGDDCFYCGQAYIPWNLQRALVMGDHSVTFEGYPETEYLAVGGAAWYGHSGSGVFVVRGGRPRLAGVLVVGLAFSKGPTTPAGAVPFYKIKAFLKKVK